MIEKTEASDRMGQILEGVKHGAVKQTIDVAVNAISDPLAKGLIEKFGLENALSIDMANSGAKFIVMIGIAEALAMLGPTLGGFLGQEGEDAEEKARLFSIYLRRYAGEKLGEGAMSAVIEFIPQALSGLREVKTEDLQYLLEAQGIDTKKVPNLKEEKQKIETAS